MIDAPLALAFTGGLVATVNPCGFAMLPAYLSYFLGLSEPQAGGGSGGGTALRETTTAGALASALRVGLIVAAGFLLVFGVAGLLLGLGVQAIRPAIPWVAMVVGVGIAVLGVLMILGRGPVLSGPGVRGWGGGARSAGSVLVFGVSYAVASLSCTLPVFLAVVTAGTTRGGVLGVLATFATYAVGMIIPLLAITVALAVGKRSLVTRLRGAARYLGRVSGVVLVLAGIYIVGFWVVSLFTAPGGTPAIVSEVEGLSATLTNILGARPLLWGTGLAVIVLVGGLVALRGRVAR